ncbi:MAG: hypothetical protein WBB23_08825 [Desulforhopalus sp.]
MNTQYNKIISSFVDQYKLSRGEVIAEIENSFSSILSKWHGQETVVMFGDDQLVALGYKKSLGLVNQTPIDLTTMRGWNTIKRILDKNLSKAACLKEVAYYKQNEREMRWGEIIKKNLDGSFFVEIEVELGTRIIATCQSNHVGLHERDQLTVGQRRAFHLRRVDPVFLNDTPRVKVTVDRVSKTLVEHLLQYQLSDRKAQIHCLNRFVGHKSFVESNVFLPKRAILATSHELKEHIQVTVVKTAQGCRN